MKYIARMSDHINEDLKRNWSSWNYGLFGITATRDEIDNTIIDCIENETSFDISGFELWGDDIKNADIRELYDGYWVLVDNVNAKNGLSFIDLKSENLDAAIIEALDGYYCGDGRCYSSNEIKLAWSNGLINIFEIL